MCKELEELQKERRLLLAERDRLANQVVELQEHDEQLQADLNWLLEASLEQDRKLRELAAENESLQETWRAVQKSASWRLFTRWRKVRERLAPEGSVRRKAYDAVAANLWRR